MGNECISLIIPVYKIEKYLDKCLESVTGQTYRNLDIMLIDDGSPDTSPEICDKWAKRDSRIRVFHKENEGVSVARNLGVKEALGKYICCVDGDDWVDKDMCEKALEVAEKENADVVMWSYVRECGDRAMPKNIYPSDKIFEGEQVQKLLQRRMIGVVGEELAHPENADSLSPIWAKLYRTEMIRNNNIQFIDIRNIGTHEDGLFNYDVFGVAQKVVYLNNYWYHYRKVTDVSLTRSYRPQLFEKYTNLYSVMEEKIKSENLCEDFKTALNNRICLSMIPLGLNICRSNLSMSEKKQKFKEILFSERFINAFEKLDTKNFPVHWKAYFNACKKRRILSSVMITKAILALK